MQRHGSEEAAGAALRAALTALLGAYDRQGCYVHPAPDSIV